MIPHITKRKVAVTIQDFWSDKLIEIDTNNIFIMYYFCDMGFYILVTNITGLPCNALAMSWEGD